MFGFKNISIEFLTSNPVLVTLAGLVLIVLGIWLYRQPNPPIRGYLKVILTSLRLLAVVALITVLLEPVVGYSWESNRKIRLTVLEDESASMDRIELGKSRRDRVDSLLGSEAFARVEARVDLEWFRFSDLLASDDEPINRDRTALGDVLEELKRRQLAEPADLWLLLTDGASNYGREPASIVSSLNQPIIAINAALESARFDIGIDQVKHNQVLFAGQNTLVSVKLKWQHASGRTATIRISDGRKLLAEKMVTIDQETGFGDYELRFTPSEPGRKALTIAVISEGDEAAANNSQTIAVKVLKSKLTVMLVSEQPDYELSFLKRYLDRSEKYEVDLRVLSHKAGNLAARFPTRQADLNRFDLLLLHDISPELLAGSQELLRSYLADRGGALWLLMGETFNAAGPSPWFNQFLPFYQSEPTRMNYREFHGEPIESQLFHPVNHLASTRAGIREAWASSPPFQSLVYCDVTAPEATLLVSAPGEGLTLDRIPLMGFKRVGPGKVFATTVAPLWHWGFLSVGYGANSDQYDQFLEGVISWLTIPDDHDPIRVAPSKEIFTRGEEVTFEAYAYDQGYRPIEGANGLVELKNDSTGERTEADLIETAEGVFVARFTGLPSGDFSFTGRMEKEGRLLKENRGKIKVEHFSMEEIDQSGNPALLKRLADVTGGEYARIDEFDSLARLIELGEISEVTVEEASLWNNYWLLLVFLSAMAVEWIIRKLNHLL